MARTIRWTESATSDLEEAAEFIARDSRFYAAALVRETQEAAQSLRSLAERGRMVPEISAPDIRELFIRNYRLIYHTMGDHIFVLVLYTVPVTSQRYGSVVVTHRR